MGKGKGREIQQEQIHAGAGQAEETERQKGRVGEFLISPQAGPLVFRACTRRVLTFSCGKIVFAESSSLPRNGGLSAVAGGKIKLGCGVSRMA